MQVVMHQVNILLGRRQHRVIRVVNVCPIRRNWRSNVERLLPIQIVLGVHELIAAGQIVVQGARSEGARRGGGRVILRCGHA